MLLVGLVQFAVNWQLKLLAVITTLTWISS